ncbi:MAG: DsbE family thiol:disulfide interchange protein [Methylobacteriaceae bacterium]|nr:DsbE family thiol:disulfide interchange protein [Methylobacteriaceae bacterium]
MTVPPEESLFPSTSRADGAPPRLLTNILVAIPLLAFVALAALFYIRVRPGAEDASRIPSALIGKPVPSFSLPVIDPGKPADADSEGATLSDADLRAGHVTLINMFASWCAPCQEEHPVLMELAANKALAAKGVRVIGIAYKDEVANSLRFLRNDGNPYAVIGADKSGRAGIDWGVYGVPETFIVKGDGTIAYKFIGPMTEAAVAATILPEIEKIAR